MATSTDVSLAIFLPQAVRDNKVDAPIAMVAVSTSAALDLLRYSSRMFSTAVLVRSHLAKEFGSLLVSQLDFILMTDSDEHTDLSHVPPRLIIRCHDIG